MINQIFKINRSKQSLSTPQGCKQALEAWMRPHTVNLKGVTEGELTGQWWVNGHQLSHSVCMLF